MNPIQFADDSGTTQELVYIEYWNGKPHSAITTEADRRGATTWDIEVDTRFEEEDSYMFYSSGGYGLSRGVDVNGHEFWLAEDIAARGGIPAGSVRLTRPHADIFTAGREVFDIVYCHVCDKHYDEDWCPKHHSEDEDTGERICTNDNGVIVARDDEPEE